ncbi:cob(I)yrinic acid a,c-diamide adenosyltransferase [Vibrio hannami]|uniref:cob(I)yrinic acid a,c-diamide adenosyltransferase n=1 Tax=Vibrio hannami TaxID=2717094 RepID=UPI00240E9DB7|nr:cob(I)yrinic acid a,c-diamide adenosyltransferase [Vibrio hannami]MDG3085137.1 cob(I)yrinic acid a,c-diamide adenosyltransferase [Vibrio hannami]
MAIYTKKGDAGQTSLIGGVRVSKSDERVDTYGTIDELNSCLSFAAKAVKDEYNRQLLEDIQHQLFYLGAEIADSGNGKNKQERFVEIQDIEALEKAVDRCMSALPPVTSFVLPGATESGSRLHLARTIARRAERRLVELSQTTNVRSVALKYLNRMSDFLYAVSRLEDHIAYKEGIVKTVVEKYQQAVSDNSSKTSETNMNTLKEDPSSLGFIRVHKMLQQAVDAALKINVPMVISVMDEHGHLIITYRMPDSLLASIELAPKKAYTAIALKCATHQLPGLIQPGSDLYQLEAISEGQLVTFGGGLPLYHNNKIIGAIGISGGSVEQDINIATAAIAGLELEEK